MVHSQIACFILSWVSQLPYPIGFIIIQRTKLLYIIVQKNHPIKKITPKIIKLPKTLKNIFNKLNHKKNKVNIDDNEKPSKNSPENPFTKENESS